ncbi:MAG: hypothetical protein Q4E47_00980 [Candidatus Saccharibacteria bacterium]|nr:hypothetical protein [Candidatus Saccharibacteria bacterium]
MSKKVVFNSIIAVTLLCVTAIIVMYGAYVPALFTGGLMIIGLVSTIDSLRILINAKREWQIA